MRIRRICSDDSDFLSESEQLLRELVERGHDEDRTKRGIAKVNTNNREELLLYKEKVQTNRIPLVLTYNRNLPKIKEVIDNTWDTLLINSKEASKFSEKPILALRKKKI